MKPEEFILGEIYQADFNDGTHRYIVFQFLGFKDGQNFKKSWGFNTERVCYQANWGYSTGRNGFKKPSIYTIATQAVKNELIDAIMRSNGTLEFYSTQQPFYFY